MLKPASASLFLADPSGSSPLLTAARWIEVTLLGTVGTIVAVICVAWIGFLMLAGRIDLRRGIAVVIGCFVLFGAPVIVAGLGSMATTSGESSNSPVPLSLPLVVPIHEVTPPPYDPYAGAAVPE